MSSTAVGLVLALGAAVALNGSYLMQHAGSASAVAVDVRRPVATLVSLIRSPLWTLGAVVGMSGWALHIGAMREAPLSLVQAFVAGGLAIAAPMAALGLRRRLARDEVQALALMVAALVLLSLGLRDDGASRAFSAGGLAAWTGILVVAATVLSVRAAGRRRPAALGLAGGLLYGAADLGLKAVTGIASRGAGAVVASPWLYIALACTAGAFFAFQRGLQGDRPLTVIALMTAATNSSSIAGALVVFGDPLGRTPVLEVLHTAAFLLIILAAAKLAPLGSGLATPQSRLPSGQSPAHRRVVAAERSTDLA